MYLKNFYYFVNYFLDAVAQIRYFYAQALAMNIGSFEELFMTAEMSALVTTAASIGFLHTVLGPDHYLPFIMMSWARKWSRKKLSS